MKRDVPAVLACAVLGLVCWSLTLGPLASRLNPWLRAAPASSHQALAARTLPELPSPGSSPSIAQGSPNGLQAGINLLLTGDDPRYQQKFSALLDRTIADSLNSIGLVFPLAIDGFDASAVHTGPTTPSDAVLGDMADLAHQRKVAVMLRPLLDESKLHGGYWRGSIAPRDVGAWFQSYSALMLRYAHLAAEHQIELLVVGGELDSMQPYQAQWLALIKTVRAVYHGGLTYAANVTQKPKAQISSVGFWSALDYVAADVYVGFDAGAVTVGQLVQGWQAPLEILTSFARSVQRPLLATELGLRAQQGAHVHPWYWDQGTATDLSEQDRYYQAACLALAGQVRGLYWWDTGLDLPASPDADGGGFNPLGKPAEVRIRDCFAPLHQGVT